MLQRAIASLILFVVLPAAVLAGETVLLDFASPTCGPCLQMEPIIAQLVRAGHPVRKVDVTRDRDLAARYQVTRVPCFVMVVDGQEVDRVVGPVDLARLKQMLAQARPTTSQPGSLLPGGSPNQAKPQLPPPGFPGRRDGILPNVADEQVLSPPAAQLTPEQLGAQLLNVTVRLQVEDSTGRSWGTGTVIDARSGEALVVTCGHLFRELQASREKGQILVELFASTSAGLRSVAKVPGQLISYDLERDIGLVSIRPPQTAQVARVAPPGTDIQPGKRVTSVGCDQGADPTLLRTRVTGVNRYQGPPNIVASGAPVEGRSGGGLFDGAGQLIGVCFAADEEANEGLYSGLLSIHAELDKIGLSEVYQETSQPDGGASGATPPGQSAPGGGPSSPRRGGLAPQSALPGTAQGPTGGGPPIYRGQDPWQPLERIVPGGDPQGAPPEATALSPQEQATLAELVRRTTESEVIFIVRPQEPGGKSEIISLDRVSPQFIRALLQQVGDRSADVAGRASATPPAFR